MTTVFCGWRLLCCLLGMGIYSLIHIPTKCFTALLTLESIISLSLRRNLMGKSPQRIPFYWKAPTPSSVWLWFFIFDMRTQCRREHHFIHVLVSCDINLSFSILELSIVCLCEEFCKMESCLLSCHVNLSFQIFLITATDILMDSGIVL